MQKYLRLAELSATGAESPIYLSLYTRLGTFTFSARLDVHLSQFLSAVSRINEFYLRKAFRLPELCSAQVTLALFRDGS